MTERRLVLTDAGGTFCVQCPERGAGKDARLQ